MERVVMCLFVLSYVVSDFYSLVLFQDRMEKILLEEKVS
jgi:hypothetical protein